MNHRFEEEEECILQYGLDLRLTRGVQSEVCGKIMIANRMTEQIYMIEISLNYRTLLPVRSP
jgi:hypothetical protein